MATNSSQSTSKIQQVTLCHTWTIDNFMLYHQFNSTSDKFENNFINTFCRSTDFSNDHLGFYLKMYPIIKRNYDKKYMSLFIYNAACLVKEVVARFSLSLVNQAKEKCFAKEADWIIDVHSNVASDHHGFNEFISYDELLDPLNGLLPNGNLTVYCKITYLIDTVVVFKPFEVFLKVSSTATGHEMSYDFEEQLIINIDPDVTLIVDKAKIKVHKNFLSSKSATFAEMLNTKKINGCIEVKNIAPTTMLHLIKYLYTGKIELEVDTIEMLKAAHQFNLPCLKSACEDFIIRNQLSFEQMSELAKLNDAPKLEAKAMQELVEYFRKKEQKRKAAKLDH